MKVRFIVFVLLALSHTACAIVYERFEENGKMGIRDDQGHVIVPPSFDALGWSDGRFSLIGQITGYRQGNRWGLLNLKKEYITKAVYVTLTYPGGNRVLVSREVNAYQSRFGCIDLKGDLVIPLMYDAIAIHDLRAVVMLKDGTRYNYGLIDLDNRVILPLIYQRITPLGTLRFAVQNFSGKTALCSEEGAWATGFEIDSLSGFRNDLAILYKGLSRGVIDRTGNVLVEPLYRDIRIEDTNTVRLRKPDTWKIIDVQQKELHRIDADVLQPLGPNRNRVTLNGKSGVVDSLFRIIIPLTYDYIGPVENEKAVVGRKGKYGLVRMDESVVLPLLYDSLMLQGHLVRARWKDEGRTVWDLYDTVGIRKTLTSYDRIDAFQGNFYPAFKRGFAGAIDRLGRERIACVYDSILESNASYCAVKFKGQYGIITLDDQWRVSPQRNKIQLLPADLFLEKQDSMTMVKDFSGQLIYFTDNPFRVFPDHFLERLPDGTEKEINFLGQMTSRRTAASAQEAGQHQEHEGLTVVRRDGKYGFVDGRGRLRIANRYEDAGDFQEGLAPVQLLGKWGYIDKSDEIVIQPVYDRKASFAQGVAIVARKGKAGLIDRSGAVLLELRYDSIRRLTDGSFILMSGGLAGLADQRGKILLEPRFASLEPAGEHYVIVRQGSHYGLLTRDGLSVFPIQYEHLVYYNGTQTFFARQSYDWETKSVK